MNCRDSWDWQPDRKVVADLSRLRSSYSGIEEFAASPDGQVLAHQSAGLAEYLNYGILGPIYGMFTMPVADVAAAFNSSRFDIHVPFPPPFGSAPLNVATICQLTYMCVAAPIGPNIHANPTGYAVIATAFDDVIP